MMRLLPDAARSKPTTQVLIAACGLADCSPLPVVMSRSGYFPVASKLAQRAATQTIVLACEGEGAKRRCSWS